MKALIRGRYGPPDVLELRDIDRPAPKEREVLVQVHAASINGSDVNAFAVFAEPASVVSNLYVPAFRGEQSLFTTAGIDKPNIAFVGGDSLQRQNLLPVRGPIQR